MLTLLYASPYLRALSDWTGKFYLYSPTTFRKVSAPTDLIVTLDASLRVIKYMSPNPCILSFITIHCVVL